MTSIWIAVLDPEHSNKVDIKDDSQVNFLRMTPTLQAEDWAQMTEMEQQLVSFVQDVLAFEQSCKAGTADDSDKVKQGFQGTRL